MSKPGERKQQILQILAEMLEAPQAEKITTAALAARVDVSEAALYRHFASKAQMYEGLIEFIETTLFSLINRISADGTAGLEQARGIAQLLIGFVEKNRGMSRVLTGEVLVNENPRLQARVNQLLDRVEASLRQSLRIAVSQGGVAEGLDAGVAANLIMAMVQGRWQQFVKSGFSRTPLDSWPAQWDLLLGGLTAPR
ncbi:MAG: nucleoid occlusion factor SlmA [Hydrogenophilales bacterium CG03_land_8_20_14_0_80_62_28]|nr:nucleoid occlusion factor SlmA [Betaproteobacteria bacterium]OIO79702.1 MAG: nucleoid occlusion factor SlmA [Hydrogenophilaceae bacterium CG1_02_62_390]PIV23512.1 MAG: nucleoid occlusion factor SlmA [Hydrogenophilales bacterium CG03_land_8_20_14_0_80_62_28]PIW38784.1 MAG: nucleoid occlusion factor SlmA [Hydrogenophilales bacterium CG15_BIG_FIL_POST_REV_8_21_14_020_62_31]PIW71715.1 MAG: nucleoid occlusion factor SlmA [Hydrogenophilales bacterium CG12_big_fil_rev_8_21_14_0_65_61_21]PIX00727.1